MDTQSIIRFVEAKQGQQIDVVCNKNSEEWDRETFQEDRECEVCGIKGAYTLDSNTPSGDIAFCCKHICKAYDAILVIDFVVEGETVY